MRVKSSWSPDRFFERDFIADGVGARDGCGCGDGNTNGSDLDLDFDFDVGTDSEGNDTRGVECRDVGTEGGSGVGVGDSEFDGVEIRKRVGGGGVGEGFM